MKKLSSFNLAETFIYKTFPYLSITTFLVYFLSNIHSRGIASGGYFLLVAIFLSTCTYVFNINKLNNRIHVPLFLVIVLFYMYVFYLSLFTRPDMGVAINSLFDSNGGALYTFLIGFFLSANLACVINNSKERSDDSSLFWLFIFSITTLSLGYFLFDALSHGFKENAVLAFDLDHEGYQRMGTMTIVINLVLGIALAHNFHGKKSSSLLLFLYCTYSILAAVLSILSLSNSGFVTNIVLMMATLSTLVFLKKNKISNIIFSFYGKYALYAICLLSFLITIFVAMDSRISSIRLFDMSNNSSFISRYNLLKSEFWEQFSVNPILGNMHSDVVVNGVSGQYVHSLLSLFTHTGVVGAAIFFAIIIMIYAKSIRLIKKHSPVAMIINVNLSVLIFISLLSTFFNWVPLWVCIMLATHLLKGYKSE